MPSAVATKSCRSFTIAAIWELGETCELQGYIVGKVRKLVDAEAALVGGVLGRSGERGCGERMMQQWELPVTIKR